MERVLESAGRSFLIAGLSPIIAFLLAQAVLAWTLVARHPELGSAAQFVPFSGSAMSPTDWVAVVVIGAIVGGSLLIALNGVIIHLYEGLQPLPPLVIRWWQRRNERRHDDLYRDVVAIRAMRERAIFDLGRADTENLDTARLRQIASAELSLHDAHARIEHRYPSRPFPMRRELVKATALGNAYAVLEEYPFERYGIDSMVFWSRLIAVIPSNYLQSIGDQKTTCDLLLNLSFLSSIVVLEGLLVGSLGTFRGWILWEAFLFVPIGLLVGYGFYRAAVSETVVLGKLIGGAFDLYRRALLRQFGREMPPTLREEREAWRMLAAFIRRGEDFYYVDDGSRPAAVPKASTETALADGSPGRERTEAENA